MLKRRTVTKYLDRVKTDGVNSIMLFTTDGLLLTHTGASDEPETTIAAIAANIWFLYLKQVEQMEAVCFFMHQIKLEKKNFFCTNFLISFQDHLQEIIIELTEGKLVFKTIADFLVCIQGSKDIATALLRAKIRLLCANLQEPLSLVGAWYLICCVGQFSRLNICFLDYISYIIILCFLLFRTVCTLALLLQDRILPQNSNDASKIKSQSLHHPCQP